MPKDTEHSFVSRGGMKLAKAIEQFQLDVTDRICADLGCSTGGFTDCWLQHGAKQVFAVDTAYGELAWKLRQDDRVTVIERTNALHIDINEVENFTPCDFVSVDLGWTRQQHAVPAALMWLSNKPDAAIITLIKPQYERDKQTAHQGRTKVLTDEETQLNLQKVLEQLPELGVTVEKWIESPIRGGKGSKGNREYLALLKRSG